MKYASFSYKNRTEIALLEGILREYRDSFTEYAGPGKDLVAIIESRLAELGIVEP